MAMTEQEAQAWATGFLQFLGAPAQGNNDPRVQFLTAQAMHEGTDATNNPLAIEAGGSNGLPGNTAISQFASPEVGYKALESYLVKNGVTGYLNALKDPNTSIPTLTGALSEANWEGSATPRARSASAAYATAVGQAAGGTSGAPIEQPLQAGGAAAPAQNANGLAGGQNQGAPQQITEGMNQHYTGPNAYKGFDLTSIAQDGSPTVMKQVKDAIDYFTANPQLEQKMISDIYQAYGTEAWLANIPEIRTLLVAGTYNDWTKDPALFKTLFQNTNWYKTTAPSVRLWQENLANDPAAAQKAVQQAGARVTDIANSLGVPLTQDQVHTIAQQVAQMSIDATGTYVNGLFPDQNIYQMVTTAFNASTFQQSLTGQQAPGASSETSSGPQGDAAYLYNQFQSINRNYMLNMSNSQIAQAVQKAIASDTGQPNFLTGQVQGFTSQAQATAQNLYPAFAGAIGNSATGMNDQTVYAATAPYRSLIAQYTGQANADTINLTDPQWSWVLTGKAPPTNRASGILSPGQTGNGASPTPGSSSSSSGGGTTPPTIDQMQQYLMATPQFQSTDMAKNMAWHVGSQILKSFGYN